MFSVISNCFLAVMAFVSGIVSYFEYNSHKQKENNKLLSQLNKQFLLVTLMLSMASMSFAQMKETLHLQMTDGTETTFLLSVHPVVTFNNNQMVITSDLQSIEIPYDKVMSFKYSTDNLSSISTPSMYLESDGEYVVFPEDTSIDDVSVYSIDGRNLSVQLKGDGHRTVLSLSPLSKGVYIVKVKNKSFKISRP